MKIANLLTTTAALLLIHGTATAQDLKLTGVIYDQNANPVADAVISVPGHGVVRTEADGTFSLENLSEYDLIRIQAKGFYTKTLRAVAPTTDANTLPVYLIPLSTPDYTESQVGNDGQTAEGVFHNYGTETLSKKDFGVTASTLDKALQGQFTGLQFIQKSGMTGEGSFMNMRGIRSFVANNNPLIVINGIPYLPDENESELISGYTRSVFQTINPQDIANVTLLKGAEAAAWGSMGSNGVLLIETDGAKSDNVDTKISFAGSFGVNWQNSRLPLMNSSQYKSYLSDIAMDYYGNDMGAFFSEFPFMSSPTANNANLYAFNTDWQDQIYKNSFSHDYLFRVEGGDAIAKYDISLGYTGDRGTLKGTKSDRYHAQINSAVLIGKKFEFDASINLSYLSGAYQAQGYSLETNPMLAAYRRSPLLSPYRSNAVPTADGRYQLLDSYSSYYFGSSTNTDFLVSNPLAIIGGAEATSRQYDINGKLSLTFRPTTDIAITALVGLYSNYDKEKLFVPGINNNDVVPRFDQYGEMENEVRSGENDVFNMFYGVNATYHHVWNNRHELNARASFQMLTTTNEYDMPVGRNTANDFYQTLGDVQSIGRYISGYNNSWNWLNGNLSIDYNYADLFRLGALIALDGASSTGKDADRIHFYPGVHGAFSVANLKWMKENAHWLNRLDVFADWSLTGNSRYSSKFGKYYYTSQPFRTIAGIIRANVPNTKLDIERDNTFNVGVDFSMYRNRFRGRVAFYQTTASDVLMLASKSSALGTSNYFSNAAKLSNRGVEVSVDLALISNRDWLWTVGGNITTLRSEVKQLGNDKNWVTTLSDGGQLITEVGAPAYSFWGYQTDGVYSTTAEAEAYGLLNRNSVAYRAGDVKYVDQNGDGIINDKDKVRLGSATPEAYGSFHTLLQYKGWGVDFNFVFSSGNKAYNAMRRLTESSSDFSNQATSVVRRWQNEGDITTMPRAAWGDVVGNNDFSDRFVEDASYVKLRDVTVSYSFGKLWNFIQSGTIYVSGQNLLCFTDYLGLDPEYSFSHATALQGVDYGKVALPKSVKLGVNLKF